jgi:hypothetical protein
MSILLLWTLVATNILLHPTPSIDRWRIECCYVKNSLCCPRRQSNPPKWQWDTALRIRMYRGRYLQILPGKIFWGACRRKSNSRLTRGPPRRRTESTAPASPAVVGGTEQRVVVLQERGYASFPPLDPPPLWRHCRRRRWATRQDKDLQGHGVRGER